MLRSRYAALCEVALPVCSGRQFYMHEFDMAAPVMPKGFEDYLEPVKELLRAARKSVGTAFLTVDEKIVKAGMSQRRPGPHVDGHFQKDKQRWGHGGWNHGCNEVPLSRMPVIVASNVSGCKVWEGDFDAEPQNDGDLSHIRSQLVYGEVVPPNVGYMLSPDCIHESMIFDQDTPRTFIRIALPPE